MKKLILLALILAPACAFAQKFGHINSADIIQNMPEFTAAQNEIQAQQKTYETELKKMQDELKRKTVDVTSGGGAVKITMNGEKQVVNLVIDPAAVDPEDVEMLQDLISAAFNEATKKVDDMMASEMGKLTSGLGLPPGLF
jgi:DNA-binding YbaB/EbfC family protein